MPKSRPISRSYSVSAAKKRTLVLALVSLAFMVTPAGAEEPSPADSEHRQALSILHGVSENAKKLWCFDVTVESDEWESRRRSTGPSLRRRMIIDSERRRYLLLQMQLIRERSITGYLIDGVSQKAWRISDDGEKLIQELRVAPKHQNHFEFPLLFHSQFPDPRSIGLGNFPYLFYSEGPIGEAIDRGLSGREQLSLKRREGDSFEVRSLSSKTGVRARDFFEADKLVPRKVILEYVAPDSFEPFQEETIDWLEAEEAFLPVKVHGHQPGKYHEVSHYHVSLEWHSFNEPDQLPEFDKSSLEDMDRVRALLGLEQTTGEEGEKSP